MRGAHILRQWKLRTLLTISKAVVGSFMLWCLYLVDRIWKEGQRSRKKSNRKRNHGIELNPTRERSQRMEVEVGSSI